MFIEIDNEIRFPPHISTEDVTSCSREIADYISDHDNWEKPIIPSEPGCSEMEFDPERFDFVFNKWVCESNKEATEGKE